MTKEERNQLADKVFNECKVILAKKGADYAGDDDALHNFKTLAERLGMTKYQVWAIYFNKHIEAVNNSIKHNPEAPERQAESLDESIKDIINYSIIFKALLSE